MKILLIDNYDSFTYNLKQLLSNHQVETDVVRNDQIDFESLSTYDGIVLSPGPGVPSRAGLLKSLIEHSKNTQPILGICLGMQAIGEVYGAKLKLMERPIHGSATVLEHYGDDIFKGVPVQFKAGRYHSWIIDKNSLTNDLEVISEDEDGLIMAIKSKNEPVYGLQFHPESVLTDHGSQIIFNFLNQIKTT